MMASTQWKGKNRCSQNVSHQTQTEKSSEGCSLAYTLVCTKTLRQITLHFGRYTGSTRERRCVLTGIRLASDNCRLEGHPSSLRRPSRLEELF